MLLGKQHGSGHAVLSTLWLSPFCVHVCPTFVPAIRAVAISSSSVAALIRRSRAHSVRGVRNPAARGVKCECVRSEEHTSELQSLMRISYAVFCLKKKTHHEIRP